MLNNKHIPFSGDKKKVIQFAVALSTVLLVIWAFLLQQQNEASKNTLTDKVVPSDSTRDARLDSLRLELGAGIAETAPEQEKTSANTGLMTTFVILVLSVGGLWWWSRSIKSAKQVDTTFFKEVARQELSTGQSVLVMEMNDEYWFLGSSAGALNLLHKVHKSECPLPTNNGKQHSFKNFNNVFSQVMGVKG